MANKKNQHYVPRTHLKQFCDDVNGAKKLWVYEKHGMAILEKPEEFEPIAKGPNEVCNEEWFNESSDLPPLTIENALGKIETWYGNFVKKLKEGGLVDKSDKYYLSLFIVVQEARTKSSKKNINSFLDRTIKMTESLEIQHQCPPTQSDELKKARDENVMFAESVQVAMDINRWQFMDWLVVDATCGAKFVTSDHPVGLYDFGNMNGPYGIVPMGNKHLEVTLPITPEIAVIGNHVDITGRDKAHYDEVLEINIRTMNGATAEFYSSQKIEPRVLKRQLHQRTVSLILTRLADKTISRSDKLLIKYERRKAIVDRLMKIPILSNILFSLSLWYVRKHEGKNRKT